MRPTGEGPSWPRPHPPPRGSFSLYFNPVLSSTVQRPVRHEGHPTTTHFQNVPPSRTAPCPRGTPTASSLPFSRPHSHHLLPVSMTGLRGLRVSGISQHLSFRDHLASLSIKSSRFIRVLARFRISLLFFFFLRPNHTALCTRAMISLCIHPSVHTGGRGGGVLPLRSTPPSTPWGAPTPIHPSVNTGGCSHSGRCEECCSELSEHVSLRSLALSSLRRAPTSARDDAHDNPAGSFSRSRRTTCHRGLVISPSRQRCARASVSPHPPPTLISFLPFSIPPSLSHSRPNGCEASSRCAFAVYFPNGQRR